MLNILLFRPSNISFNVCETPKKVLRERVDNYRNMFEMSMKENNELREFTTLEKQMFYNNVSNQHIFIDISRYIMYINYFPFFFYLIIIISFQNEQLKDLSNLRKQVENLQTEKNESEKMIDKLKNSIQVVEHEKRDIEVIMEVQKNKYDKREMELLATIQVNT